MTNSSQLFSSKKNVIKGNSSSLLRGINCGSLAKPNINFEKSDLNKNSSILLSDKYIFENEYNYLINNNALYSLNSQSNIDYLKKYFKEINYDLEKVKQLIYDAPDFESALKLLVDVVSAWNNTSKPLYVPFYTTPILESKYIDDLGNPELDLNNIDDTTKEIIKPLYKQANDLNPVASVNETNSIFFIGLENNIPNESVLFQITIDNNGRFTNIQGSFKNYDPISGEPDNTNFNKYYFNEPIPEGTLSMSTLPEKLRTSLINHPTGNLPDPNQINATVTIVDPNDLGIAFPSELNGRNMIYSTNDFISILSIFITNLPISSGITLTDENIIATNVEGNGLPPFKNVPTFEDFKTILNSYRDLFDFPLINW